MPKFSLENPFQENVLKSDTKFNKKQKHTEHKADEAKRKIVSEPVSKEKGREKNKVTMEQARQILGDDFYGREEVEDTFGFEIKDTEIPPIPYSSEELEDAKELGESLVLRISHDEGGKPMTMKRIYEIMKPKMGKDHPLLLDSDFCNDVDYYKNEAFFKEAPLKTEWKLIGSSFVDGSKDQNYVHQTRLLRDHLKSVGSLSAYEEQRCSDEVLRRLSEQMGVDWDSQEIVDKKKYEKNWKEVARELSELKVNVNHRRTLAEIIYDYAMKFKETKDQGVLKNDFDWSRTVSSRGEIGNIGMVRDIGARVTTDRPGKRHSGTGVISVR